MTTLIKKIEELIEFEKRIIRSSRNNNNIMSNYVSQKRKKEAFIKIKCYLELLTLINEAVEELWKCFLYTDIQEVHDLDKKLFYKIVAQIQKNIEEIIGKPSSEAGKKVR